MKAVVWHGVGNISLEDVDEPMIREDTDAIVRITASAICGTDLHFVRGTATGLRDGTILGHEGIGIIEKLGRDVRNFEIGDRVVIPSTIACGNCTYCRAGYYSQCNEANPNGPTSGTAFYGGPAKSGPFQGLQAEKARVPFASVNLVKLPDAITDDQGILLSDIFPTGYYGADIAEIRPGNTVAVFGCGPVGLFAIVSAKIFGAGRVFAIDHVPSRLQMAREQGAEVINFDEESPIKAIKDLTEGIGVDRVIDAVGVDAECPHHATWKSWVHGEDFAQEVKMAAAPKQSPTDGNWVPGDAPSQALQWAVEVLAKAGTLSIIGVYPDTVQSFPIGKAMNKNLTIQMGNCPHRKYIPDLIDLVLSGTVDPAKILTSVEPLQAAIDSYKAFDKRSAGWTKVELRPDEHGL